MLRKYQDQIALALFAFWALGFVFQTGRSTQHREDRKQIEGAHKSDQAVKNHKQPEDSVSRPERPANAQTDNRGGEAPEVTFIGLKLGEGLLVFVTVWLVLVTRALVNESKDSSRRSQRAYIGVEPRGIVRLKGEETLIGHYAIRNVGGIPAKNIAMYSLTSYFRDGSQRKFPIGQLYQTTNAVVPNAEMSFGTASVTTLASVDSGVNADDLTEDQETASGVTGFIFVWGRVTYTDDFGTDGWTDFCHRYPCAMLEEGVGSCIDQKYARYHELGGNDAG